jgi:allantoin racemase
MRIRAITPIHVDADELERRRARYARLAPEGVSVHLDDLGEGPEVPRALDTAEDVRRSESLVLAEARRTDFEAYDAVLPDCVLDPGVGDADDVPMLGILQLSAHLLASTGQRVTAVARNEPIAAELERKAVGYGLAGQLTNVRVLGLDVTDIADDAAWGAALARGTAGVDAPLVINGCSAVEVGDDAGEGPRVVDPTALALRVLGLLVELGLVGQVLQPRVAR